MRYVNEIAHSQVQTSPRSADSSNIAMVSTRPLRSCLMKKEPTEGMWMDTAEEPLLRAGELLIRVKRAAICGTDVHIYKWDEWSQR